MIYPQRFILFFHPACTARPCEKERMALCVCVSTRSLVVIQCCEPRCFSLRFFFFFSFFFLFFLPRSAKNSVLASTISLFVSCTSFIPARIPCFACTHLPTEVSKTRKHFQRAYKFYSSDILTSRRLNCFFPLVFHAGFYATVLLE